MPLRRGSKGWGSVAILALGSLCHGQVSTYLPLREALRSGGTPQGPTSQRPNTEPNPLIPPGNPGLPAKESTRLPNPGEEPQEFEVVRAGSVSRRGDVLMLEGGTEFLYKGYRVFANSGEGNLKTEVFTLRGDVRVIGKDTVVNGESITVDFKDGTYRATDAESQIAPNLVGGALQDKLYVRGRESFGAEREFRVFDGHLTTCNLDEPHYHIEGGDIVVRPGRRAILRDTRIRLFGRTIAKLPFLVVPLEDRNYNYLPDVGQSPDEGFYVKNRYGVPVRGNQALDTRLDYMSRLGTGYGAGYNYGGERNEGFLRFYSIAGPGQMLNIGNSHRQTIGKATLTVENDYQRSNYLTAPDSTLLTSRAGLNIPWADGTTRLSFGRTANDTGGFQSTNQTIGLSDSRQYGRKFKTSLDLNWVDSSQVFTNSTSKREQVDLRFRADNDIGVANAILEYQRTIPIGDIQNFFSGSDRTPFVSLQSDSRRLFGEKLHNRFPFRTEVSMGEFQAFQNRERISRANFELAFQKSDRPTDQKPLSVSYNGQFRQGMYSDDTAQYVLNFGSAVSYRLGRDTSANFRYNYLRPYGYSPLAIDRTGRTNLATADISVRPVQPLLLGVQTGYDMMRLQQQEVAWQQVGIRAEYTPAPWFLFRSLSSYDTIQQQWSSLRFDVGYNAGATSLSVGARYDGIRQVWSNANIFLNNLKIGRARLSAILAYNGYTKQFDSRQYNLIYDLHCAEAVLNILENNTGFRSGREVQFLIRLKAFPFDGNFGVGRRGQPLGTGTGVDF